MSIELFWLAVVAITAVSTLLSITAHYGLKHWRLRRPTTYWGAAAVWVGSLWALGLAFDGWQWALAGTIISVSTTGVIHALYLQEKANGVDTTYLTLRRLENALSALYMTRVLADEVALRLERADDLERMDPRVRDPIYDATKDIQALIEEAKREIEFVRNGRVIYPKV